MPDCPFVVAQSVIDVALLFVSRFFLDKVLFKGGHLFFAEQRGTGTAPQVPHGIEPNLPFGGAGGGKISKAGKLVEPLHQISAAEFNIIKTQRFIRAILIHRNTAMVEQIAIVGLVDAAFGKQKAGMALQFFTVQKTDL